MLHVRSVSLFFFHMRCYHLGSLCMSRAGRLPYATRWNTISGMTQRHWHPPSASGSTNRVWPCVVTGPTCGGWLGYGDQTVLCGYLGGARKGTLLAGGEASSCQRYSGHGRCCRLSGSAPFTCWKPLCQALLCVCVCVCVCVCTCGDSQAYTAIGHRVCKLPATG